MESKKYEISVSKDGVASKCKLVDKETFDKLMAESDKVCKEKEMKIEELSNRIDLLEKEIGSLVLEIKTIKGEI